MDTVTRHIENPLSRELITFLRTGEETGGELFAFEVRVPTDMVAPPAHLHAEEERLEVLDGEVTVRVDGRREVLRAGERLVWRPGVAHTWWNSGPSDLRLRAELWCRHCGLC